MKEQVNYHPHDDLEHEVVHSRARAMIDAGTHPMIADRLARDAARGQLLRDHQLKLAATIVQTPVIATETAVVTETVPVDAPDLHA